MREFACNVLDDSGRVRGRFEETVEQVLFGDRVLGFIHTRVQPARRVNETLTCVGGHGVEGYDLAWVVRQHGFRLVD